jgi:acyl-CoA reductase-like NAD-dependent aldehyde dehydrogenase
MNGRESRGNPSVALPRRDLGNVAQTVEHPTPATLARSDRLIADAVDSARRESIASISSTPAVEIPAIVSRARKAAASWEVLPAERRVVALAELRRLIARQTGAIAETIARSMGKPLVEAFWYDVVPVLETLDACIARPEVVGVVAPPVVCVIAPFTLPFERALAPAVAALAAGSAVVIKPASSASLVGALIARLFEDAFADFPGLAQVVQGGAQIGSLLATAEDVDRVVFSGARVSALRLRAALEPLRRSAWIEPLSVVPLIVCEDANLERAANASVYGRFCNNGQGGSSVNRILVHRAVAAEFAHRVVHKVRALKVGPYTDAHCELGPLASSRALPHLLAMLQDAIDNRAAVLTGGAPLRAVETAFASGQGFYWPPTVLSDVAPSTRVMREETFGPILAIGSFRDESEAIALANGPSHGSGACVFSGARERAAGIARALRARRVAVNDVLLMAGAPGGCWQGEGAGCGGEAGPAADQRPVPAQQVRMGNGEIDREPTWFP